MKNSEIYEGLLQKGIELLDSITESYNKLDEDGQKELCSSIAKLFKKEASG